MVPEAILLVDLLDDGHHRLFMDVVIDHLLDLGHHVICFSPDPLAVRQRAEARGWTQPGERLQPIFFETLHRRGMRSQNFARVNRWLSLAWTLLKYQVKPSKVLLLYGDSFLLENTPPFFKRCTKLFLDYAFPWEWAALYFHPSRFRMRTSGLRKEPLSDDNVLRARSCIGIGILDEGLLSAVTAEFKKPVVWMPDVHCVSRSLSGARSQIADQIAARSRGRFVVGLVGILQRRKNLLNLLKAAHFLSSDRHYFVVCGALERSHYSPDELSSIDAIVAELSDGIFYHPAELSDVDFQGVAGVVDAFFAAYSNFPHSSNIMTVAAIQKVPVVVGKGFLMHERIERYKTGVVVDETSVLDISECIAGLPGFDHEMARWDAYLKKHSLAAFNAQIEKLLRL